MNIEKKINIIINGLGIDYKSNSLFLLDIIDNLLVGILIIDLNENVLYVNDKYTDITGVKYNDIVGKKLLQVRPNAQLCNVVRNNEAKINLPRREGKKKYFVDLAPIKSNGKIIGGITIMKDFDDVKIMSKQLKYFEDKVKVMEYIINNKFGARYKFDDIIGQSEEIKNTIELAKKIAKSDTSALLIGKTGTGKELFAHSIHNFSKRENKPFIPINCAAIPLTLIESELFGYAKGSFTGSEKDGKIGLFELAEGGTIFLDEIENMSLDLQAKLLRVLQDKKVRRVGATENIDVDVRIISATNISIEKLVEQGSFREDLYYRICVMPIVIPDLIDRKLDIKILCDYFLQNYNDKNNTKIKISNEVYEILYKYKWPGNVRELHNTIEYLASIDDDLLISSNDLPNKIKNTYDNYVSEDITLKDAVRDFERKMLARYLIQYGNGYKEKKKIANLLQISIATLYNKLSEYDLL